MLWLDRINPQMHHLWAGSWPPGAVEPLRTLCDHELVVFAEGTCDVLIDDTWYACPPGSFLVIPPGRLHLSSARSERVVRHCVHFDWAPGRSARVMPLYAFWPQRLKPGRVRGAPGFVPRGPLHGSFDLASAVVPLLQTMRHRWTAGSEAERRSARALLLEVLLMLLSPREPSPPPRDRAGELAARVKDVLDHLDITTTGIRAALESLGHSYEHLMRVFTQQHGISPLRYVNSSRLEKAKLLLRGQEANVAAIARRLGFQDPAYFARAFRRYAGVPPSEYAARTRRE